MMIQTRQVKNIKIEVYESVQRKQDNIKITIKIRYGEEEGSERPQIREKDR